VTVGERAERFVTHKEAPASTKWVILAEGRSLREVEGHRSLLRRQTMVVQMSEVVAKGNRQFEGSGRRKLAGVHCFGGEDRKGKANATQRMVGVPVNDGKRQTVLRHRSACMPRRKPHGWSSCRTCV